MSNYRSQNKDDLIEDIRAFVSSEHTDGMRFLLEKAVDQNIDTTKDWLISIYKHELNNYAKPIQRINESIIATKDAKLELAVPYKRGLFSKPEMVAPNHTKKISKRYADKAREYKRLSENEIYLMRSKEELIKKSATFLGEHSTYFNLSESIIKDAEQRINQDASAYAHATEILFMSNFKIEDINAIKDKFLTENIQDASDLEMFEDIYRKQKPQEVALTLNSDEHMSKLGKIGEFLSENYRENYKLTSLYEANKKLQEYVVQIDYIENDLLGKTSNLDIADLQGIYDELTSDFNSLMHQMLKQDVNRTNNSLKHDITYIFWGSNAISNEQLFYKLKDTFNDKTVQHSIAKPLTSIDKDAKLEKSFNSEGIINLVFSEKSGVDTRNLAEQIRKTNAYKDNHKIVGNTKLYASQYTITLRFENAVRKSLPNVLAKALTQISNESQGNFSKPEEP